MVNIMRNSSLYVSISAKESELDKNSKNKIKHTFKDLFEESAKLVSEISYSSESELIYEIKTPVIQDDQLTKELYENLEVMFYELAEYNPHFTQFRRVDK